MSKINLKKEAAKVASNIEDEDLKLVTEEVLLEACPKAFLAALKKAKGAGDRVDLYDALDEQRKDANRVAKELEDFQSKLKRWFIQQLPTMNATGVAGKKKRIQIVDKDRVSVDNWDVFYEFVRKNKAFEFFERKVKLSAAQDRWNTGKQVPGLSKFTYKSISLTKK